MNAVQNLKKEMFHRWIEYNKAQETYILNQKKEGTCLAYHRAVGETSVQGR